MHQVTVPSSPPPTCTKLSYHLIVPCLCLKCTAMHFGQPANTAEKLNIQPSAESDRGGHSLRAAVGLGSPQSPQAHPFQTPLKLGDPTYPSSRQLQATLPPPPCKTPGLARDGLPGGGGRRLPSDGLPGGGGGCKGISRQTVVPSTDASKENTCEATFALMRCQCVSCNTKVIEDPKER